MYGATSRSSSSVRIHSPTPVIDEAEDGVSYHDVTPRFGAAYDIFGNGRTAIKVNIGKYLVAADGSSSTGGLLNPLSRVSSTANRNWTDADGDFFPDCDLRNPNSQDLRPSGGDFCGASSNRDFGLPVFSNVRSEYPLGRGARTCCRTSSGASCAGTGTCPCTGPSSPSRTW